MLPAVFLLAPARLGNFLARYFSRLTLIGFLCFATPHALGQSYCNPITINVAFEGIDPGAIPQQVTFTFHPLDGSADLSETHPITPYTNGQPGGAFTFTDIPANKYQVKAQGLKWLSVVAAQTLDSTAGPATLSVPTLPAGDANNDNSVDSTDFGLLIGVYGNTYDIHNPPVASDTVACDFNCDGSVDSTDFGLLIGEYGNVGQDFNNLTATFSTSDGGGWLLVPPSGSVKGGQQALCTIRINGDVTATNGDNSTLNVRWSPSNSFSWAGDAAPSTNAATNITPTGLVLTHLRWVYDSTTTSITYGTSSLSFPLNISLVNYPIRLYLTATYTPASDPPAAAAANLLATPTNLWVADIYQPNTINLAWDFPAGAYSNLYLLRAGSDGSSATLPTGYQGYGGSFNDTTVPPTVFAPNAAPVTYTYTLCKYSDTSATPSPRPTDYKIARTTVTPYVVSVQQDQAVDSRIDPRRDSAPFLDFQFGGNIYKGGLFAGYIGAPNNPDNSRKSRSFAQFAFPAQSSGTSLPANQTFLVGDINAYFLGVADPQFASPVLDCYALPSASVWKAQNTTGQTDGIVWSNSLTLMQGATLEAQSQVSSSSTSLYGVSVPAPSNWMRWSLSKALSSAISNPSASGNSLSVALTAEQDTSDTATVSAGWAYLAKKEYDATKGPCVTYALGTPIPSYIAFAGPMPGGNTIAPDPSGGIETYYAGTFDCSVFLAGMGLGSSPVTAHVTIAHDYNANYMYAYDYSLITNPTMSNVSSTHDAFDITVDGLHNSFQFRASPGYYYDQVTESGQWFDQHITVTVSCNGVSQAATLVLLAP